MARPIKPGIIPAPRPGLRRLFGCSALCGASLFAVAVQAQTLPTVPLPANIAVTTGGTQPVITAPDANTLDVNLQATRTVINWDSFHVSGADSVTFHFGQASDIVLNRSPTAVQIDAGGQVAGKVGAAVGGNIWFYSPQGVVIAPGAVMSAGNFVFARGDNLVDLTFVDAASPLDVLRGASDALIQIDTISLATSASINASGDLVLSAATGDVNATTALAAGSATVTATAGSVTIGEVTATAGAATVTAPAGSITLGALNGGAGASATGLVDVSVTSAWSGSANGDIVLTGGTSASLGDATSGRDIKVLGPTASLGSGNAAGDVFVTATTGSASVTGSVSAGDDIEVTATTGSVTAAGGGLTSTGVGATDDAHVLARSTGGSVTLGSATTQGTGAAAGDITIDGATTASLTSGTASRDIKVLGPTATLGSGGAARDVFVTATTGSASVTGPVTAGDDIEVTATTGSVTSGAGALTATGVGATDDAHVLARSTGGSVTLGSATTQGTAAATGDIVVDGAVTASLGSGNSTGAISVTGPTASLGSGSAAGDVFVTATTGSASVTGSVSAGDDIEVTATTGSVTAAGGGLTSTGVGATDDAHVLARSTGGSVTLGSAATQGTGAAAGDITIDGATTASLGAGTSSRDIKVQSPMASLGSGAAARDVFVTATTGAASVTGSVSAGDDIEVTATTGSVTAAGGALTSTGVGATDDAHVLARSTGGSVALGSATTQGTGAATGDVVVEGATTASLGSGASSRDIRVTGPAASLGSGSAAGDVSVTATTGSASVTGSVSAGDDIEVTATTGSVTAAGGSLTSTGVGAPDDAHVLARSTGGSVTLGSAATQGTGAAAGDVTIDGATTASVTGAVNASRDVQLIAGDSVLAGGSVMVAGRDLVARAGTGDLTVGAARAGDDVVLRALTGSVTATGDLQAGQTHDAADPDPAGAADTLLGSAIVGHDLDLKAQTIAVAGHVAAGRAPDVGETLGSAQLASDVIVMATNADPVPGVAALRLATGPGKAVTAHRDISLRAENPAGASIQTGDVSAGRDVAVYSPAGSIAMGSALAGDDVVLRAPSGAITVTGDVAAGRDSPGMTPADAAGVADDLNAALPFVDFDGNPGTVFSVVGFDVNIASQAIHIGGATVAGRQPSTDAPDTAGPIDATTSDVRLETLLSPTPVLNLAPNIDLGSVTATRDLQIDSAKAVTTGDLKAGRDIAVLGRGGVTPGAAAGDHSGSGVTLGSAHAGDDALAFSIYGRTHVQGSVTSGLPFQRLVPTNDRIIDGATEAADQLAIYLHYFDLDDASTPYVLPAGVIHISGEGVTVGGALAAHGAGSDVRVKSSLDIAVTGPTSAGGLANFQTQGPTAGSVTVGAVTAAGDVFLDGAAGTGPTGVRATGALTSTGGDVAVRARDGAAIVLAGISAGDDVVLRATGAIQGGGTVSTTGRPSSLGLADRLIDQSEAGALTVSGLTFGLSGSDIDIIGDVVGILRTNAMGSVRIKAGNASLQGGATVGVDILIDSAASLTVGDLSATGDIALRSRTGSLTVGRLTAGDDIVLRAAQGITATLLRAGGVEHMGVGDQLFAGDPTMLGEAFDLQGGVVDVRSAGGSIAIGGAEAPGDVRLQTTGGAVSISGPVMAGGDILADGGSVTATGGLTAGRDVALYGRAGGVSVASIQAGDDIVVWASGDVAASGELKSGQGAAARGVGDRLLAATMSTALFGEATDADSGIIDLRGAGVRLGGPITAGGAGARLRLRSTGAATLGDATVSGDIAIDSAGDLTAGALRADRDIALRASGGAIALASATAGDDIVLRAAQSVSISGQVSAGQGADETGAADGLYALGATTLGGGLDLAGQTIDIASETGSVTAMGRLMAGADVRLRASAGAVSAGDAQAARDVLLDGRSVEAGAVTAGRDIAIRASAGGLRLGSASAGDDLVLRAAGDIQVTGALSAVGGAEGDGVADRLFAIDPSSLGGTFELAGRNIDVKATSGAITTQGALTATQDIRMQASGAIAAGGVIDAARDVLLDGDSVSAAALRAARDVAVRARGGSIALASVSAGDDVVLRAAGDLQVMGAATAGGGADGEGAGDRLFATDRMALAGDLDLAGATIDARARGAIAMGGPATAAGDARFQTLGAGAISLAAVTAGGDILADGAAVQAAGQLSAGRDVAVRGRAGTVELASITAGDDIAIRATGDVRVAGALASGSGPSASGAADRLISAAESGAIMRLVDPLAATASIEGFALAAGDIDIRSGGSIGLAGDVAAAGSSSLRLQAAGRIAAAGVTAGDSIFARSGDLSLGGDWRARTVRLEVTAAGGLALGEGVTVPSGGLALSSAAIGMIDAPTLQIFLGDSSGSMRGAALSIGALGIDVARIRTALELYAGPLSEVVISGAFAPTSGAANTTTVRIGAPSAVGDWTPKSIKVVANRGGSIGASTTTTGRLFTDVRAFGAVELNATGDILIGYQDFIDKLAATPAASVAQAIKTFIAAQTASGPRMLITAGTLTLRADGKVAQQDTSGLLGSVPTGLYLLGGASGVPQLLLGRTSVASAGGVRLPDFIELNGALTSGATIMTGQSVSLANVIAFDRGVAPSGYYRLNSCAILQPGSCTPSAVHSNVSIAPDQLTGLTLEDHTAAAGTADPTVASATNEEVWKDPN